MTLVIGIDPGSRRTGYGVIDVRDRHMTYVASGTVHAAGASFLVRLEEILRGIEDVLSQFDADVLVVEEVFGGRNAHAAVKLGQARGVVLASAMRKGVPIVEYAPRRIKQTVTGLGSATKETVRILVARLLHLDDIPPQDSADALAAAICHILEGHLDT